jgi:hypothetical protein
MKFAILDLFLLTGCGQCRRTFTNITGELTYRCSESGVEYIQSDSGLALHVHQDGRPVPCKG